MMSVLKKVLSYLIPIPLESKVGQDNVSLDVYYDQGKIKLFTKTTNYSGGKLKSMFRKALKQINFNSEDRVLILGFGMGSVWEIIKQEKKQNPNIYGVDYEPLLEEYMNKYSPHILLDNKTQVEVTDALSFVQQSKQTYSYIIIDLFIDNKVAPVVFKDEFVFSLRNNCDENTMIILNTMEATNEQLKEYQKYFNTVNKRQLEATNVVYYFQPREIQN